MKFSTHLLTMAFTLIVGQIMVGQTTNIGEVAILPNTIMSTVQTLDNKESADFINDGELFLYSHFNNDGLVSYTQGKKGYTRFQGTISQKIEGSVPSEFYNVIFNNPSSQPAFHLYGEMRVGGNVDFSKGIVQDDDFDGLMVFENDATHSNTDDESHVDGLVRKNGKSGFVYPIGDKNRYRFAGISAPAEQLSSFKGKYFYENSAPLYSHNNKVEGIALINNQEYWTLDKTAGNSDVMLTLSWDETSTTPADIIIAPQSSIHIVRWDAAQKLWIDEGGIVDSDKKTVTTPLNVSGYNVFTTARIDDSVGAVCSKLIVHNAFSPNGDDKNDYFKIDGLTECSSENTVEIYNRWGVKVFETDNYDTNGNVFKGYSEGRVTVLKDEMLPTGTYFYILHFKNSEAKTQAGKKAGYLYLSRD